jgi:uncharacterized protein
MKNSTTSKKNLNQEQRVARPVAWVEVVGKDGERLRSFFSDLFGWETAEVAPGSHHSVMDASPHGIGGGIGPSQKGPGHVTFFVEVDDLEATLQDVERLGRQEDRWSDNFPRQAALSGRSRVREFRVLR